MRFLPPLRSLAKVIGNVVGGGWRKATAGRDHACSRTVGVGYTAPVEELRGPAWAVACDLYPLDSCRIEAAPLQPYSYEVIGRAWLFLLYVLLQLVAKVLAGT